MLLLGGRAAGGGSAPLPAPPQHNTKSVHVVNRRLKNSACSSFKIRNVLCDYRVETQGIVLQSVRHARTELTEPKTSLKRWLHAVVFLHRFPVAPRYSVRPLPSTGVCFVACGTRCRSSRISPLSRYSLGPPPPPPPPALQCSTSSSHVAT